MIIFYHHHHTHVLILIHLSQIQQQTHIFWGSKSKHTLFDMRYYETSMYQCTLSSHTLHTVSKIVSFSVQYCGHGAEKTVYREMVQKGIDPNSQNPVSEFLLTYKNYSRRYTTPHTTRKQKSRMQIKGRSMHAFFKSERKKVCFTQCLPLTAVLPKSKKAGSGENGNVTGEDWLENGGGGNLRRFWFSQFQSLLAYGSIAAVSHNVM